MKFVLALCLVSLLAVPAVLADDPPKPPVKETWATSEGNLTLQVLPYSFQGIYDQDNGRMVGTLGDGVWTGYWGEDSSGTECKTVVLGTKYWGRISFTFDKARKHFDGKWSYCDEDFHADWTGDIAK